jgi:hypothetical protein
MVAHSDEDICTCKLSMPQLALCIQYQNESVPPPSKVMLGLVIAKALEGPSVYTYVEFPHPLDERDDRVGVSPM